MLLKIGELARRTGLTVRTLHHYDAIGLLRPSARSAAGYRLYDRRDIERLHRIQALRRLDLPLGDIAALLAGGGAELESVIAQQMNALEQQIARAVNLRERLRTLQESIRASEEPDLDEWLTTLSIMNFYDRYLSVEESEQLRSKGEFGDTEFIALRDALRAHMSKGDPPDSAPVLALAGRWITLSSRQLAGDARLLHKVHVLHRDEADVRDITGIDDRLLEYIVLATAEYRLSLYARHIDPAVIARVRRHFLQHYDEWPALFAEARALQESGASALSPEMLDLARRWIALFVSVWGQDPRLHQQVLHVNQVEPALMDGVGIDAEAVQLVRTAIGHLKNQS